MNPSLASEARRVEQNFRFSNESLRVSARGPALFSVFSGARRRPRSKSREIMEQCWCCSTTFKKRRWHIRIGTAAANSSGQELVLRLAEIQHPKSIISPKISHKARRCNMQNPKPEVDGEEERGRERRGEEQTGMGSSEHTSRRGRQRRSAAEVALESKSTTKRGRVRDSGRKR
jgi:hypothetical protein